MTLDLAEYRHIHLVGIGGIGMSALARVLVTRNYQISGSDREPSEETTALRNAGVAVSTGHRAEHVQGADLVVISSAVPPDNVEVREASRLGIPIVKRAELLAAIANTGTGIAIAGTHGKTTTSALIGHILLQAGTDPTILIGGIGNNLGSNARVGGGDLVVVEADEYDDTFLHLRPAIGVITNVACEHLDFFHTPQGVHDAFRRFAEGVSNTLVICADDPVLPSLVMDSPATVVTYGTEHGEWRATGIEESEAITSFRVRHARAEHEYSTALAGEHNVRNALAAIATAHVLQIPTEIIDGSLASFTGVRRRFESKGEAAGILVMDDYAVHPTEVKVTLGAIKRRFRRPIRVVFQPHTYSRMKAFLPEFAVSFADADAVYVMDVYAAREADTLDMSGRRLADALTVEHSQVCYVESAEAALDALRRDARAGDIVVTMGAGNVTQLGPALLAALEER